jgi:hypothetical protein
MVSGQKWLLEGQIFSIRVVNHVAIATKEEITPLEAFSPEN